MSFFFLRIRRAIALLRDTDSPHRFHGNRREVTIGGVDRRIPTFDDQRSRRHSNDDSEKFRTTVEIEISRVTYMALELICREPVSSRLEHFDWLEALVSIRTVAHEHKLQGGRDHFAPKTHTNTLDGPRNSGGTTNRARHHQGRPAPRAVPDEERLRPLPMRTQGKSSKG